MNSTDAQKYIGSELELFKDATTWKTYFSKSMHRYVLGDVLEVGAGIGINTKYLRGDGENINSWTWVEPDKDLAKRIEEETKQISFPKAKTHIGTLLTLGEEKFDTIIYIDVLEHIDDSSNEIAQAKAHLKNDGHLIILVPAYGYLYNDFDKALGHFRRYEKKLLLNEIDGRLSQQELYYKDSLGFFASLVNKWFLKQDLPTAGNIKLWDKTLVPLSKITDKLVFHSFGKSLIGIFKNDR